MKFNTAIQALLLTASHQRLIHAHADAKESDDDKFYAVSDSFLRGNYVDRKTQSMSTKTASSRGHRVLISGPGGAPLFIRGNYGVIKGLNNASDNAVKAAATSILENVLLKHFGASGNEKVHPVRSGRDPSGGVHVRFNQEINGMTVEAAAMVLHTYADGTAHAVNGEFVNGKDVESEPTVLPDQAMAMAIAQTGIKGVQCTGKPELCVVHGMDGIGHLAYKCTIEYDKDTPTGPVPQRDILYSDATNGNEVQRIPTIYAARDLETKDCNQKTFNCRVVSTSPNPISTGDEAIDSAHNFAIATYDYYWNNHGRDSIDDAGMTLISRVHYSRNYNNAFWDGTQMTYGDGDGVTFVPLSQDADVVAHELTHGVTERTSGLIYQNESGALNEALSDIFGAMVDRQEGAEGADIWYVGEDITPNANGIRNMACPSCDGYDDYDYYPTRYTGTGDNGGVHINSGIANLAFVLLANGGTNNGQHPVSNVHEANGGVTVPTIGFDAAADIFYAANVNCLTPSSNFAAARYCTADVHGGANAAAVHLAWDAVGVPTDFEPPIQNDPIALTDDVPLQGQDAATGNVQSYTLANVGAGEGVTCSTTGNNGDADLYLRFGQEGEANPSSSNNECGSYSSNSNEQCSTGAAPGATTLYATVHAYNGYTGLTVQCTNDGIVTCDPAGAPCSNCCNGCSGGKPSTRVCL